MSEVADYMVVKSSINYCYDMTLSYKVRRPILESKNLWKFTNRLEWC